MSDGDVLRLLRSAVETSRLERPLKLREAVREARCRGWEIRAQQLERQLGGIGDSQSRIDKEDWGEGRGPIPRDQGTSTPKTANSGILEPGNGESDRAGEGR